MIPLHDDNPTTRAPVLTVGLIAACTLAFLAQWQLAPAEAVRVVHALGVIPQALLGRAELAPDVALVPPGLTPFTAMFLHGGWMHLIGNMLYLWVFGNNVEDAMGHVRFLVFYALCGLLAALVHVLLEPDSRIPMVGASGAISGVLGAYLLLHPHARVLAAMPLGPILYTARVPAVLVLGLWFLLQVFHPPAPEGGGGVAWYAHIGGFIAGMLLVPFFKERHVPLFHDARAAELRSRD